MSELNLERIDITIHKKDELNGIIVKPFWGTFGIYVILDSENKIIAFGYSDNIPVKLLKHKENESFVSYGYFVCSEKESELVTDKMIKNIRFK